MTPLFLRVATTLRNGSPRQPEKCPKSLQNPSCTNITHYFAAVHHYVASDLKSAPERGRKVMTNQWLKPKHRLALKLRGQD
jgi:hypothetical protein